MNDLENENENNNQKQGTRASLSKQLFVVVGTWLLLFLHGIGFGIPTVMIPQIRKAANSTDAVSPEMSSWLYSIFGYSSLPWIFIMCFATRYVGRKIPFVLVCLNMFIYFNFIYFSTTLNQVLIAEIMQGVTHAAHVTLTPIIITEYATPKYRGLYITIKTASFFWGVWVANAIGTFCHWKYIPLLGVFLSVLFITVIFWPESPQWLASRGHFDRCRMEHRWLRGTDIQSEKELEHLIRSQSNCTSKGSGFRYCCNLRSAINTISCKVFYKPALLTILLGMQYSVTGKMVLAMYAIDIIKKITTSESTAYMGMLILDGVTIAGMYTGCILSIFVKRRTLLFSASLISIAFQLTISLYLFLIDMGLLVEDKVIALVLLNLYSIAISCGPQILVISIGNELIPLRYKSSLTTIYAFNSVFISASLIKSFPSINATFHMSGIFLILALMSIFCSTALYIYLPETKDKSLQEIEDVLMGREVISQEKELLPLKKFQD